MYVCMYVCVYIPGVGADMTGYLEQLHDSARGRDYGLHAAQTHRFYLRWYLHPKH
jgi:hypothetical protein